MAFILDNLLLSPIKLTLWLAEKLKESALSEMTDDAAIHEQLLHLQMKFEMDEIDEAEFERQEDELLHQLEEIRKLKDGLG